MCSNSTGSRAARSSKKPLLCKEISTALDPRHHVVMARLIYTAITSLDGYVADETGSFDWAAPDEEVHAAVNDLERGIGTYLYGRRIYEVMVAWETMPTGPGTSPV